MLNTGRLLKCSQSYAEENDDLQKQAVAELTRRVQQLESAVSSADRQQSQWEAAQQSTLQVLNVHAPVFVLSIAAEGTQLAAVIA